MRLRDRVVSDNAANKRRGLKRNKGENGRIERVHKTTFIMVTMMALTSRIVMRVPLFLLVQFVVSYCGYRFISFLS